MARVLVSILLTLGASGALDRLSGEEAGTAESVRRPQLLAERTLVIVPKKDDRVDRPKATTETTKIDDKVEVLRVAKADATDALGEGIAFWKSDERDWLWIVTAGNDASNLLNNYDKVEKLLKTSGISNYKVVLLNPNEKELNDESLGAINDPNLAIAETKGTHTAKYTEILEKHKVPHNEDIIAWVHAREVYKPELSWDSLGSNDLYKLARVATGTLGPKSLPKRQSPTPPPEASKESILAAIRKAQKEGPSKTVAIDLKADPWPEGKENVYKGWSIEEIVAHNEWFTKNRLAETRADPRLALYYTVDYRTWGDLLNDIVTSRKPLPESYSNREKWEKLGFKALNQTETAIGSGPGGCTFYSIIHAVQLGLLERGETKKVDHLALEKIIHSRFPKGFGRYGDLGLGTLIRTGGVPIKGGGKVIPQRIVIGDISDVFWDTASFPSWLKDRLHVHTKGLTPQYELATAFRDEMMKHEISNGRPVKIGMPWPDDRVKSKWGPKVWVTEHNGEAIIRLISHPSGLAEHTVLAVGYKPDPLDPRKTLYECVNSWGPNWADRGYVWVSSEWLDFWNNTLRDIQISSISVE